VLEDSRLLRTEKQGRVRTCSIDADVLARAETWLNDRRSLWLRQLDRLGEFLSEDAPASRPRKRKKS
jgi:hypothetical protein